MIEISLRLRIGRKRTESGTVKPPADEIVMGSDPPLEAYGRSLPPVTLERWREDEGRHRRLGFG